MALTRELPSNKIAEKYVISSALTDIASANYVINEMRLDDFTDIKYRRIFESLISIGSQNKTLNLSTILSELSELNYLDEIGGSDYINNLISDFIDIEGLEDNIRLLQDKRIAREVIVKMDELTTDYYKNKFDTDFNFLTASEMQISEIVRTRKIDGFKGIKEVSAKIKENIELAYPTQTVYLKNQEGEKACSKIILSICARSGSLLRKKLPTGSESPGSP